MQINNILNQWGLNISANEDYYEYLCSIEPEKCFYIDRFPLLIKNHDKYSFEEMYYDKVMNKELSEEMYNSEEMKFVNVVKKLWLYNTAYIETNILEERNPRLKRVLKSSENGLLNDIIQKIKQSQDELFKIENGDYLNFLIKLGIKEGIYTSLFFLEYKMIIIAHSMCFPVYINDMSKIQLIKEIVCTEGLYLRSCGLQKLHPA